MIDLIALGIINVGFIWGINCAFSEGYFLEGAGKVIEKAIGTKPCKPLFLCPPCMSSVWGGLFFWAFANATFWLLLPYVICLCGINFIIKEYLYP